MEYRQSQVPPVVHLRPPQLVRDLRPQWFVHESRVHDPIHLLVEGRAVEQRYLQRLLEVEPEVTPVYVSEPRSRVSAPRGFRTPGG